MDTNKEEFKSKTKSNYYFTEKDFYILFLVALLTGVLSMTITNANLLIALIIILGALGVGYFFWKSPHTCLIFYFIFMLFQGLIVENVSRKSIVIGEMLQKVDEAFILLIFFMVIFNRVIVAKKLIRTNIELPFLCIVVTGLISSMIAEVPLSIMSPQLFLLIKGFMVFYILANLPITEPILKKYIKVFLIVSIIIFLLGIIDFMFPEEFRTTIGNKTYIDWRASFPSVESIFIHPGVFGWFMSFIALYAFAFLLIFNNWKYLLIGLVFSIGSFLSMRRKAIAALIISVLIGLLVSPVIKKVKLKYILIFALVAILLIVPLWSSIETIFKNLIDTYIRPKDPMLVARNALYIVSGKIAIDYFPFGVGLGRYGSWMSRVYYSPVYYKYGLSNVYGLSSDKPDFINDTFWPMILGELGIFGLFFYIWIIIYFIFIALRQSKLSRLKYVSGFCLGTFMILIESLVESIGQPVYTAPPQCYFVFAAIGIVFALKRKGNQFQNSDYIASIDNKEKF